MFKIMSCVRFLKYIVLRSEFDLDWDMLFAAVWHYEIVNDDGGGFFAISNPGSWSASDRGFDCGSSFLAVFCIHCAT